MFYLILAFVACDNNHELHDLYVFEEQTWQDSDTAIFKYSASDTTEWYFATIDLMTTKNYRFSNLWLYFIIETPDDERTVVAHQIPVAHPDGSWIGKRSGNKVQSRLKLSDFQFPIKGDYTFKMVQATQDKEIANVNSIIFSLNRKNKQ